MADETTTPAPEQEAETTPEPQDPAKLAAELEETKGHSRKHERRAKEEREKRKELENRLAELENANKPVEEQQLEKARNEGRREAMAQVEQERRNDRLEIAIAKRARDVADVSDVLLNIRHALAEGSIEAEDIFGDDGQVNADRLNSELDGLLESKPHLRAQGPQTPQGDADGGRGEGGVAKSPGDAHNDLLLRLAGKK